jgi:choline dehydrogenase
VKGNRHLAAPRLRCEGDGLLRQAARVRNALPVYACTSCFYPRTVEFDFFDYVVIGAGSAGCVLANRLSANSRNRILVLEAGQNDNWIWFHIPVGYLFAIGNPRADWMFKTEPQVGLGGRSINYPRGKVIGGCSAINGMIYMRGQAADYNQWRQAGLFGWGWDDVLPYFLRHENHVSPPNDLHRSGGEWCVDYPRTHWEILDAVQAAAEELGIPKVGDFNTGDNFGSSYFQVNQHRGARWSAAKGFLKPALSRPNLKLETNALVHRIRIENGRAIGVDYEIDNDVRGVRCGQVVLSAGAIGTPQILQMSGIGPADLLHRLGIVVQRDLPGVGQNLQDHLQLRPIYKVSGAKTLNTEYRNVLKRALMAAQYALQRRGPMSMAPSQLGLFAKSSSRYETSNVQMHVQPLSLDKFGDAMHGFSAITASICNLRPTSRGSVTIASNTPRNAPEISPNYLSTREDRLVAVESLRLVRNLMKQPSLARYRPVEFRPGPEIVDDKGLEAAAAQIGTTIFHPVGTAKMGTRDDPYAVVDERLRLRGIERLSVVDASVMPTIISGNINSPTMMIAEKGAAMLLSAKG